MEKNFEDIFFDDLVAELKGLQCPSSLEASQLVGWNLAKDSCIRTVYSFFGKSLPKGIDATSTEMLEKIAIWNSAMQAFLNRAKAAWLENALLSFAEPPLREDEDAVNHPKHYNFGSIEAIDAIEGLCLPFHLGTALKYIARAGRKDPDKLTEDLRKAVWYINRYINFIGGKNDVKR